MCCSHVLQLESALSEQHQQLTGAIGDEMVSRKREDGALAGSIAEQITRAIKMMTDRIDSEAIAIKSILSSRIQVRLSLCDP